MKRPSILALLLSLSLALCALGCEKSNDPCEQLYNKLSRCKDFSINKSMETERKQAFLADCKTNFPKGDRLGKCLKMNRCNKMMITCRNSQDKPRGKDVRKLFGTSAKELGGK